MARDYRDLGDDWLKPSLESAAVFNAAEPFWRMTHGDSTLDPRLWEALRLELQRRYRIATGEEHAILLVEESPATCFVNHRA